MASSASFLTSGPSAATSTGRARVGEVNQSWFLMRDAHSQEGTLFLQPRLAMSFMRGPMTRSEIRRALALRGEVGVEEGERVSAE